MKPSFSCLCFFFLLCLLQCGASGTVQQGDALNKFYFNNRAGRSFSSWPSSLLSVSNLESKVYDNSKLKEGDKVVRLPGQPAGVHFDQYAGYVTFYKPNSRALFYYFVEAAENSGSKPLVLWLNGGPGCSSLGYGAMEELGPFRVMSDGKTLYKNPYAWNEVANVLFLKSFAGVGFSYSNTTLDYAKSGDRRTAIDALIFLVNWFERFPEYKGRDFFITGESYAGHYVPQLAHAILHYKDRLINLKGIAIGNAVINEETDRKGMFDYFWTHALIADETIVSIHKFCNFSLDTQQQPPECDRAVDEASRVFDEVNIYNIYAPLCFSSGVTPTPKLPSICLLQASLYLSSFSWDMIENFDPCTSNYVEAYLNNPAVQKALHANVTKLNYTWSGCSGDFDGRVPVTSTRYSLNKLKLKVKASWRAWMLNSEVDNSLVLNLFEPDMRIESVYIDDEESYPPLLACAKTLFIARTMMMTASPILILIVFIVNILVGGYIVVYDHNLTFVTVRGAGHEVPSYQPARALEMIKSFFKACISRLLKGFNREPIYLLLLLLLIVISIVE
ncbi:hypothetical protein ZIOFF_054866 [Zingiber officinale]|uniref:Carboxypeptidase n=1 Tax=Zingiber officinale TaxID=94328 RepID=A0A8J5FV89_ZINOF|nr:hypothetical protein ZIOFF_054866 [Zingiber officinale]